MVECTKKFIEHRYFAWNIKKWDFTWEKKDGILFLISPTFWLPTLFWPSLIFFYYLSKTGRVTYQINVPIFDEIVISRLWYQIFKNFHRRWVFRPPTAFRWKYYILQEKTCRVVSLHFIYIVTIPSNQARDIQLA